MSRSKRIISDPVFGRMLRFAAFFLLVISSLCPAWSHNAQFAHTEGKYIVDASGKRLLLRGINLGNWLVPEGYMLQLDRGAASPREIERLLNELVGPEEADKFWSEYRNRYITRDDIKLIRRAGFNSIRIPLHYKLFLSDYSAGFRYLDQIVAWARESGLLVILDLHCAPGGQTGTNIDDSWGYPWLFESARDQDLAVTVWARIAAHYRQDPTVLGYDLLNEPIPPFARIASYKKSIVPLYLRMIKAIRETDTHHILILEGADWAGNFDIFSSPVANNVIYSFHKYWTAPVSASVQEYIDFRDRYNVPVWMGESGENSAEWIHTFVQVLNENQIGWCFWPYKKMAINSAVTSFPKPVYWDEIARYAEQPGTSADAERRLPARPPLEHIHKALNDLLQNIQLDHCAINTEYVSALGLHH